MATMSIEDVQKELNEYISNNKEIVSAGVYSDEIQLNKYCKTITAVKGKFPAFHKIMGHVVQGFKAEWQELGEAEFKHKMLKNYRQKVNFPIVPDEVLNTWLAELYVEGKTAEEHPISKHIMEDLMAKVTDDLDDLSQSASYDAGNFSGAYGGSIDGIEAQRDAAIADTDHPAFKIPLNAITPANILDEFKSFEKQLPKKMRKKVKRVFVSDNIAMEFADQYEQQYGTKPTYTANDTMKTPLAKLEIVGLHGVSDDFMVATVDGNLGRLIDVFDKPQVTDIQKQDYKLKIFMDWHLGYDFLINELTYVAVFDGSDRGLGNADKNALYYDSENLVVTP
ncbi:hypothetical protein FHS04_001251 [Mesoflavibacter sabulilitoris]|uniref:Uncharacterized protein n=1 Tax=Mesoflavibacter zeaxanthinifaciens subsp. sabulilitoris TaxID=1520893 RepID=A0A2T1NAK8_9FLAO|nr:hypothetical protein [Mesoflavibacter zeaxanthinifaciens]MBB3123748.1 hypothetical protein [Mesoflavibacter zeaxanthinifaciens subsp. sabulilitoris]PSG89133.1 hypothetical protein C7H61_09245 [Mesoflavibacter zeaxanthinifaciens subsp. sabulilitoris]